MLNEQRIIDLFMELVQIDSISLDERLMANLLIKELTKLGGTVREDSVGEKIKGNTGNVIADFSGNNDYPRILLSAHMDRVVPGKGIIPVIKDNYIMSRGETVLGADDAIGLTTIIESLRIIQEKHIEHGPIKVIFSVAEELGLLGTKKMNHAELIGVDYGIVLDADGEVGTVVYNSPAQVKINIIINGNSYYNGIYSQERIKAIKIANLVISRVKQGKIDEETSASISILNNGRETDFGLVELEGEVRSFKKNKLLKQIDDIRKIVKRYTEKYKGVAEIKTESLYPRFSLDRESDIIRLVKKSIKELKLPFRYLNNDGGSDANIFNHFGLPTVNLGTGLEKAHSTEERVMINNLNNLVRLIITICKNNKGSI